MDLRRYFDRVRAARRPDGFTVLEMIIVVAIIGIMTAMVAPPIVSAIAHTKLRGGASSLAGLVQSGRMEAVKRNRTLTMHFVRRDEVPVAFVSDVVGSAADPRSTDAQVQLGSSTFRVATPTGGVSPLTSGTLSYTPLTSPALVSFNPQGLPCAYASGTCTTSGFVYYLQDVSRSKAWSAVSISPGGRVKQWFWNGKAWTD